MSLLKWSPLMSVEVDEMDAEHRRLIGLVNTLSEAMRSGRGRQEMIRTFDALADYTRTHFASEERYMSSIGYPRLEEHRREHQELIDSVARLKRKFEAGDAVACMRVMGFLGEWVRRHIRKSDKLYGEYAKQKA